MRNEIGALTAQGKMSGILVAALPVFILAAIGSINPTYIKVLFSTSTGRMILGGAIVMEAIGGIVISKLIKVEG
jgi:tight adherence protein B